MRRFLVLYQSSDEAGSERVCLLDVPVNKTSTAFTKPVVSFANT